MASVAASTGLVYRKCQGQGRDKISVRNLKRWLQDRLKEARTDLKSWGIPAKLVRAKVKLSWVSCTCYAYVNESPGDFTVYVNGWWARSAYLNDEDEDVLDIFRHELAHLILKRRPDVARAFRIPKYPGFVEGVWLGISGALCEIPEEQFADRVGRLSPRTMKKLARVCA
jgi:hypothetical protein